MQSLLIFTVVVCAAVSGSTGGEDECGPKSFMVGDCCAISTFTPSSLKGSAAVCKQKHVTDKYPRGYEHVTLHEMNVGRACSLECIFYMEGLLTADKKLDKAAITKHFTPTNAALASLIATKIEQCLGSYEDDIDSSLECKSGAKEFMCCFLRGVFLDCPSSLWTESSQCDDLKAKTTKCPKTSVFVNF